MVYRQKSALLCRDKRWGVANKAKDIPCMDCGAKYPPYVMDFDHRPGENKVEAVSALLAHAGIQRVIDEIAKCDVVCANCHRERTHNRTVRIEVA